MISAGRHYVKTLNLILMDQDENIIAREAFGLSIAAASGAATATLSFCTMIPPGQLLKAGLAVLALPQRLVDVQAEVIGRWPDGSVQWLRMEVAMVEVTDFPAELHVRLSGESQSRSSGPTIQFTPSNGRLQLDTGVVRFELDQKSVIPIQGVSFIEAPVLQHRATFGLRLIDLAGESLRIGLTAFEIEASGPVRATVRTESQLRNAKLKVTCRTSFYAGSGLVKLEIALDNPSAARHASGLWDLGDPGSFRFRDFSVELSQPAVATAGIHWSIEKHVPLRMGLAGAEFFSLHQESSGGENWNSSNHVNAAGTVPCAFRGYRLDADGETSHGNRATPTLVWRTDQSLIGLHFPEFWQHFPKVIALADRRLRIGLFPDEFGDTFELQGGERKTHVFWLQFAPPSKMVNDVASEMEQAAARLPVLRPLLQGGGPVPDGTDVRVHKRPYLDELLDEALTGPRGFIAQREAVDEYGWRHFGEIVADHEQRYYNGPQPLISHYNNQYDMIYGLLLNYLRTGDERLFAFGDALARHVVDIDIYHTVEDRWAFNGGLFWHTDHYCNAYTATHRAYSRRNRPSGADYGGGPACEHNYTTGLYLHYCLTGDRPSRDAVVSLADWVVRMDDGQRTPWRFLDGSQTGLATATYEESFHGPGRGAGNSINALLDGWRLTGELHYLEYAETLIRRCIHPQDDIAALDLLNIEARWSYTVFLTALLKYLELKALAGAHDVMFHYARESLVHYALWMAENELSYFDRADAMQYPTETWAAQDLRKANVLRLASAWVDHPCKSRLFDRGSGLAQRAWRDLRRFETRSCARPLSILMVEALKELHTPPATIAVPNAPPRDGFGPRVSFVTQKQRITAMFTNPSSALSGIAHLVRYPIRRSAAQRSRNDAVR